MNKGPSKEQIRRVNEISKRYQQRRLKEMEKRKLTMPGFEIEDYDFSQELLPETVQKDGKTYYVDPVRQKLILAGPEETVRQHVVSFLMNKLHVPLNMLNTEESMAHHTEQNLKRADIVINSTLRERQNDMHPLAVIECKAEDVLLDDKAYEQVLDYACELQCPYFMLTGGHTTYCYFIFSFEPLEVVQIKSFPEYVRMINEEYDCLLADEETFERHDFEEYADVIDEYRERGYFGMDTPDDVLVHCVSFLECLGDTESKFPTGDYEIFTCLEDMGLHSYQYGTPAGGYPYHGEYRTFRVRYDGEEKLVGIQFENYLPTNNDRVNYTALHVVVDDGHKVHSALQLSMDKEHMFSFANGHCVFRHDGALTSGRGSVKRALVRYFVEKRFPFILSDDKYYLLGDVYDDGLWEMTHSDVADFVENLISYALVRDDVRHCKKFIDDIAARMAEFYLSRNEDEDSDEWSSKMIEEFRPELQAFETIDKEWKATILMDELTEMFERSENKILS